MIDTKQRAKCILEEYANYYSQVDLEELAKYLDIIKAEAYKEFAERFGSIIWEMKNEYLKKGNLAYASAFVFTHTKLQNLLKETVGGSQ